MSGLSKLLLFMFSFNVVHGSSNLTTGSDYVSTSSSTLPSSQYSNLTTKTPYKMYQYIAMVSNPFTMMAHYVQGPNEMTSPPTSSPIQPTSIDGQGMADGPSRPQVNKDRGIIAISSDTTTKGNHLPVEQVKDLLDDLFNDYDTRIRPKQDQRQSIVIQASFIPVTVIAMNTQKQILSINGYFKLHWKDELLNWTLQDGYPAFLRIPATSLWLPKIKIAKNLDNKGVIGSYSTDIVLLHYNGKALWYPEGIYNIVCQVDITFYPYDKQHCTFTFYADDEEASDIQLELLNPGVDMREFIDNAEWEITNATNELRLVDNVYYIDYHFTLKRRVQFATFTLIVPALSISLLCSTTFLVPVDTGEKGSLSMNVFLACFVYLTLMIDLLPHNSLTYSHFLLYVTILLFISTVLVLCTIAQLKIVNAYGYRLCSLANFIQSKAKVTWKDVLKLFDSVFFVFSSLFLFGAYFVLTFAL